MATIPITNIVLGGMSDSDYFGTPNSVAEIVGCDIHSQPGKIIVNQKLRKESGTTIDSLVKARIVCSDGNTYLFGATNGKIWKRTSAGIYTLEATATPNAGSPGILDAEEHDGYLYYAMQSRLGRVQVGAAWTTRNDNYGTFTVTDATYHPMKKLNGILYIGDGNLIAQVENGTFSANALDLVDNLRVSTMGNVDTDLLIGTYATPDIMETQFIRWNTWSDSWSYSDPIPEVGINAFLVTDNDIIVSAGTKGHLYAFNGTTLQSAKMLPGTFTRGGTEKCTVHHRAVCNFVGIPLFGVSNVAGNPAKCGIWSYARRGAGYPYVLAIEYVLSVGKMADVQIGMIVGVGDGFLVSWQDGNTCGIDAIDPANKYGDAYILTRWMMIDRVEQTTYGQVDVAYAALPTGTDIAISAYRNAGGLEDIESVNDDGRMLKSGKVQIGDATKARIKVAMTASGNSAPEIEGIYIDLPASEK